MANYNKDYMAAYKQYGQSMMAGGGGSNMSGTGSSTMQVFNATRDDNDKPSKGLAAKPTTTTKEDKPSFWDRITSVFEQNEVDVTNVYKPSVDPAKIYNQPIHTKVPEASDYVYRADMSERTQDMVEQAMGYEKPQLGQLQLLDTSTMTQEEKDRFGPLLKLADDIRNQNITTTELPPIEGEEQSSLMDALMEGQPTGLMSRPSSFTGASVDVASNIPDWMSELSAAEMVDAMVGIREGTVDPETGQTIQSAEDVTRETVEEFNARRRRERGLPTETSTTTGTPSYVDDYLEDILESEGLYQDDVEDTGNYVKSDGTVLGTMRGITPRVYARSIGKSVDSLTVEDMKSITEETAKEIYREEYWNKPKIDKLPDNLKETVFDMYINAGGNAVKILQDLAGLPKSQQDGAIGPITIKAVNDANITKDQYADRRIEYYRAVVKANPKKKKYLNGWINRANKYRD